jgi:sugar phosphate isomerase/epimerase
MVHPDRDSATSRRTFLKCSLAAGSATLLQTNLKMALADTRPDWKAQIGLELYTVRDLMAQNYEGVLAQVAEIGYKEVEPASGYNNLDPRSFRALLDRYGLSMPSTHSNYPSGRGAELEKQLEAQQIMGIRYTEVRNAGGGVGAARNAAGAERPANLPPGAYYNPGTRTVRNSFKEMEVFGPYQPRTTLEAAKKRAAELNANGRIAAKFGIKLFVHNHTGEFERLADSDQTEFEILVNETDPNLVTMQLDIGWVYVAGVDPVELFNRYPGRYELWHVKDVFGLNTVNPKLSPNERQSSLAFGPIGTGHIDYKKIFANAALAGLKHFAVEQDNAAVWGDSLAAARISYQNLLAVL